MFKKNAIQLKLIKLDADDTNAANDASENDTETKVIEVIKESAKFTMLMFVGYKTIDTMSKITIHIAETKIK